MLLTFILTGTSIALYNSTAYALFSKRYSHLPQGRLMGTLVATFCLANVIAALLGGWLASMDVVMLIVAGGVIAISAAVIYILKIQFDNSKRGYAKPS